jgi:hypothetical protein
MPVKHRYTQPVKEMSRRLALNHAVHALTRERSKARILQRTKVQAAWDYCTRYLADIGLSRRLDVSVLRDWLDFVAARYRTQSPDDLRVAYLCGPEPDNDLRVLTDLGVRIENVWAIEADDQAHHEAIERARATYPSS